MRAKFRLFVVAIALAAPTGIAAQSPNPPPPTPPEENEKPEYTRRALPAESFNPSEKVSEDFPVPFPVDI